MERDLEFGNRLALSGHVETPDGRRWSTVAATDGQRLAAVEVE